MVSRVASWTLSFPQNVIVHDNNTKMGAVKSSNKQRKSLALADFEREDFMWNTLGYKVGYRSSGSSNETGAHLAHSDRG